ncbi:MAG: hypothetical protein HFI71_14410 [Lachnospiraceae bacterium]|jgi:hypothetical protein|nr:hypothetical protein [Lachnospiraceae bacterium]
MTFIYILLGVIIGGWLIKRAIVGSGVWSKIIISLFVIVIAALLLKLITGYAVFISLAKICASLAVLFTVVNIIRRMFIEE